ncbi:NAD(P)/FAD-dependent oxidoreductase [Streptomyces sp. P9(2023)]|uniref:NAD(P)/FAD-dependent oxidoreductase n=1 Tax=Streptomyces sp. P9(2023) TaxID=3064394 RepID=UPI0028F400AA|nr:NAD(P)/FAD-dependent oxidoreductase [Streptomyces sp. P9(2023)]MDT9687156.1 NAD(P)/FAD-dependent oxidoreductase [Streptomyces sp. P9(2023)]
MSENTNEAQKYDVVVVGGGAAGLSAALVLGRSRRRTLVVDAGEPRNAPAAHMQGYLSRDGMSPAEFLATGRREIAAYGVEWTAGRVTGAVRDGGDADGFVVTVDDGRRVLARRLIVTTGLVDEPPAIDGVAERWGREVLHCPYCHGWEVRDQAFGAIAHPVFGAHQALIVSQWSADVTLFPHTYGPLPEEQSAQVAAAGIEVVPGEVAGLAVEDDRFTGVRMADGRFVARDVLFVGTRTTPRDGLLTALGAETRATPLGPFVAVDETGRTSVPGVWAAGNATGAHEQVINAASGGYRAGVAINMELIMADLDRKVAALTVAG